MIKKVELWHWSLRYVEGNFGTGLVAFFTFIKWLLYLNLSTCILLTVFIILPEIFFKHPKVLLPDEVIFFSDIKRWSYQQL